MTSGHDPLRPHRHDPNPHLPGATADLHLALPDGRTVHLPVAALRRLPPTAVGNCVIVSTGHGASGPFTFRGVALRDLVEHYWHDAWSEVEVVSADGFGNRVTAAELHQPDDAGPILLAYGIDERPLTREEGLVRLIVPGERDDALRQVKWVAQVRVRQAAG